MNLSLTSHSPRRPPILRHVRHRSAMWTGHRLGSALVRHLHRRARWRPRNRECTCRLTSTAINSFSLNSVGSCPLVICTPRCHTSRHASQRQLGLLLLAHRLPLRTTPQSGRPKRRRPCGRPIILCARWRALSPRRTRTSCVPGSRARRRCHGRRTQQLRLGPAGHRSRSRLTPLSRMQHHNTNARATLISLLEHSEN